MKMQQTSGGWVFGSAGRLRVCRFRTRTSAVARMPRGLLIVLGVVAGLLAMPSRADEVSFFRIGTGSTSGTYFPVGGLIASAISQPPGSRPCDRGGSCGVPGLIAVVQSTTGSVANVDAISEGALESGFSQADIAYWASTGTGMFAGRGAIDSLRTIANFYPESLHLVVRRDLGVWRVPDLRGYRISLDREGSGSRGDALLILEAYGLGPDDIEIVEASPGEAVDMMREGTLDGFFMIVGTPGQAVAELADESLITLLPIDGVEAEVLTAIYPFFSRDFIPSGTYFNVPMTETLSVGAQWLVRADLPEQQIYEVTRALWHDNTRQLLESGHPKGQLIRTETALDGLGVPLHPGAARYYREAGLLGEGEVPENGLANGASEAGEATNAGEGPEASPAPESE